MLPYGVLSAGLIFGNVGKYFLATESITWAWLAVAAAAREEVRLGGPKGRAADGGKKARARDRHRGGDSLRQRSGIPGAAAAVGSDQAGCRRADGVRR